MSPTKHTKFSDSWLGDGEFQSWLARDKKSDRSAKCKLCMCTIELSNMGRRALTSHLTSKKHVSRAQNKDSQGGLLKTWIQSSKSTAVSQPSAIDSSFSVASNSTCSSDNTNITSNTEENKDGSIMSYAIKEEVFKAEILWTLNLVRGHQSYNSSKNTSALFNVMFPDSSIAKKFSCGPSKCSYLTVYFLAPYFKKIIC